MGISIFERSVLFATDLYIRSDSVIQNSGEFISQGIDTAVSVGRIISHGTLEIASQKIQGIAPASKFPILRPILQRASEAKYVCSLVLSELKKAASSSYSSLELPKKFSFLASEVSHKIGKQIDLNGILSEFGPKLSKAPSSLFSTLLYTTAVIDHAKTQFVHKVTEIPLSEALINFNSHVKLPENSLPLITFGAAVVGINLILGMGLFWARERMLQEITQLGEDKGYLRLIGFNPHLVSQLSLPVPPPKPEAPDTQASSSKADLLDQPEPSSLEREANLQQLPISPIPSPVIDTELELVPQGMHNESPRELSIPVITLTDIFGQPGQVEFAEDLATPVPGYSENDGLSSSLASSYSCEDPLLASMIQDENRPIFSEEDSGPLEWNKKCTPPVLPAIEEEDTSLTDSCDNVMLMTRSTFLENQLSTNQTSPIEFEGQVNFLAYLRKTLESQEMFGPAHNEKTISVGNDSFAISTDPRETKKGVEVFHLLLIETYGKDLANRVWKRYQLDGKQALTWLDVKKACIGIGANLQKIDLELFYRSLKRHFESTGTIKEGLDPNTMSFVCALQLSRAERARVLEAPSFTELENDQIEILVNAFRRIVIGNIHMSSSESLFMYLDQLQGFASFDHFVHDLGFLNQCGITDGVDEFHLHLAAAEYNGKVLIYKELKIGMIVPPFPGSQNGCYYEVLETNIRIDGVFFHILAPINPDKSAEPTSIYLNFRGTQPKISAVGGPQSAIENLDPTGIAKSIFERDKERILKTLDFHLSRLAAAHSLEKFTLEISGHSQAGVHSQRLVEALLQKFSDLEEKRGLSRIQSIKMYAHNSPAPETELNDSFKQVLDNSACPAIHLNYLFFETDPVQSFGGVYLGLEADRNKVKINVIMLRSEKKGLANHGAVGFIKKPLSVRNLSEAPELEKFEINNLDHEDLVNTILRHRTPDAVPSYSWELLESAGNQIQRAAYYSLLMLIKAIPDSKRIESE
ncbi:MAG: hypothetical protein HKM07_02015 [Chlamydiae bacterium]|nr:hypothetical protein [Chlamydiota bacterium]